MKERKKRTFLSEIYDQKILRRHLLVIVTAVLSFSACYDSDDQDYQIIIRQDSKEFVYELPYQEIISSQTVDVRTWKEVNVQLVRNFSDGLFSPVRIITKNATTFVLDAPDGYIKKIDHDDEPIAQIGQGKGNGPGEFTFPFDFDIDRLGNFVVMDIAKRIVVTLDPNGEPLKTFQFGFASPTTLKALDETRAIVMINGRLDERLSGTDGLFQTYNRETNKLELFNDFLSNTEHLPP